MLPNSMLFAFRVITQKFALVFVVVVVLAVSKVVVNVLSHLETLSNFPLPLASLKPASYNCRTLLMHMPPKAQKSVCNVHLTKWAITKLESVLLLSSSIKYLI